MKSTPHIRSTQRPLFSDRAIFICGACGLSESTLTTDCPERRVSSQRLGDILHSRLDYVRGVWIDLDPIGKAHARERLAKVRADIVARLSAAK